MTYLTQRILQNLILRSHLLSLVLIGLGLIVLQATPASAQTGTQNKITKWINGTGTLGDSTIFEDASGNIGIGTTTPGGVFDLQRASSGDILQRFWNQGSGGLKLRYVAGTGATSQIQFTDGAEWLMSITGNNAMGMQFRVRNTTDPNSEAGLDGSARMTIFRNGNVGIGTVSPVMRLDVRGTRYGPNAGYQGIASLYSTDALGAGVGAGLILGGAYVGTAVTEFGQIAGIKENGTAGNYSGALAFSTRLNGNNPLNEKMRIDSAGSVGIGTTSPGFKLDLQGGQINASGGFCIAGDCKTAWSQITGTSQWTTSGANVYYNTGNVGIGTSAPAARLEVSGGEVRFPAGQGGVGFTHFNFMGNGQNYIRGTTVIADNGGNVGIGTTSPTFKLDLQGGQINASGGFCIAGDCKTAWSQITGTSQWTTSGANVYYNAGNVGIGTTSPTSRFTVSANTASLPASTVQVPIAHFGNADGADSRILVDNFGGGTGHFDFRKANTSAASPSALLSGEVIGSLNWFGRGATAYSVFSKAYIRGLAGENWSDSAQGTHITLATAQNGTITTLERMRITDAGNVGIGTTTPGFKLDLQGGQINASGGFCIAGDCKTAWSQITGSSQWTTSGANVYYNTGNVGIGTTSPGQKLSVAGTVEFDFRRIQIP